MAASIAGCETTPSDTAYWGALTKASVPIVAPAVRPYTAAEQDAAAAELATLPANSIVAGVMIPDYQRMRDQARRLSE